MNVGRPRTKQKDLPPWLYWNAKRGYFFYRVTDGVTTYGGRKDGFGKVQRETAIKAWVKMTNRAELETKPSTFAELIDLFIRVELPLVKSPKTRETYELQCRQLRERWGDQLYGQSTQDAIARKCLRMSFFERYLRAAEQLPAGRVKANRDVTLAHRIFRIAIKNEMTEFNPVTGVEYIEEEPRAREVTQGDRDAIAKAASVIYRLMMQTTEAMAWRLTDVRLLKLTQIRNGEIELRQSKTGNIQKWEITPKVQAILDEAAKLPGRRSSIFVFPNRKGLPYTEDGIHKMRKAALKKAGLSNLQHRDFRKEAIKEAKRQGMNAQEFAGHSDVRTTNKHYTNDPVKVRPNR